MTFAYFPHFHGNDTIIIIIFFETYLIYFDGPKNVHFDINIIIARTEAKALVLLYCCKW